MPTLQAVIRDDGGTGEFDTVTLDTAAYEALYDKRADFVITFSAWEGVEAEQRGIAAAHVQVHRLRVPGLLPGGPRLRPRTGSRPTRRRPGRSWARPCAGFELAAASPDEAAAILVEQNPGIFDANPELPAASARFMAEQGLLVDEDGKVGVQTLDQWTGYSSFLYEQGLLADAEGKPLAAAAGLRRPVHERLPALRSAAR